jgi:hypothetical protein
MLTKEIDPARFTAFQARAKAELKFDPSRVKPATAAARVLKREGYWERVWDRFARGGRGWHDDVAALLTPLEPPDLLSADPRVYAAANARQETELRAALTKLGDKEKRAARDAVVQLAKDHKPRCSGPWAARGEARLAHAVRHLSPLAETPPLPKHDADTLGDAYATTGWEADDAAIRALEAVAPRTDSAPIERLADDRASVVAALRAIYIPFLQRNAEGLQHLLRHGVPQFRKVAESDAVLFVDGLVWTWRTGWPRCCGMLARRRILVGAGPDTQPSPRRANLWRAGLVSH